MFTWSLGRTAQAWESPQTLRFYSWVTDRTRRQPNIQPKRHQPNIHPRKPKTDCSRGDTRLRSPPVTVKNYPAQAGGLVETPASGLSQRSQHRNKSSLHTALPQQLHSKAAGPQDKQGAELGTGDMLTPQQCKHCPWAHLEKHLSSPTPQVLLSRVLQRLLTKFLGTHGHLPTKSIQQRKGW